MHDQSLAGTVDRDLVEQAGRDQGLQCCVARSVVELAVRRGMKIRSHSFRIDAAVALDDDQIAGRLGGFGGSRCQGYHRDRAGNPVCGDAAIVATAYVA